MNTIAKGDRLERSLYEYLEAQRRSGALLYGVHSPDRCEIFHKKSYFCGQRQGEIEFDVVVEITAEGQTEPHSYLVFECKNYKGAVPETEITDFSSKLSRIFGHSAKGIFVHSSRLQKGAECFARSQKIGLAKFDEHGIEVQANRTANDFVRTAYIRNQFFEARQPSRPLKFSATYDGQYFVGIAPLLIRLFYPEIAPPTENGAETVPYLSDHELEERAAMLLRDIGHTEGAVNLSGILRHLDIKLRREHFIPLNEVEQPILGSAHFESSTIFLYPNDSPTRERFTLAHEIGHFYLKHAQYLTSEVVVERDLFAKFNDRAASNLRMLEIQANKFASHLLMPKQEFLRYAIKLAYEYDFRDRGHGLIYVDDQQTNLLPYMALIENLCLRFDVSKKAAEIKLSEMGVFNDNRSRARRATH